MDRTEILRKAAAEAFDNCFISIEEWLDYGYSLHEYVTAIAGTASVGLNVTPKEYGFLHDEIERMCQ